jgi:hypothetical protein
VWLQGNIPLVFAFSMALTVKHAGASAVLSVDEATTLEGLEVAIRSEFGLPADAALRILAKGKALRGDARASLGSLGVGANAKLMVMQTGAAERTAVETARPERMRGFEDDDRRARTGGLAAGSAGGAYKSRSTASPYRFGDLRALPVPPGAKPGAAAAEELLRRLSTDASILAIMRAHRWTVGRLSEMPPEGQVGVSASCLMGLNRNAGEEVRTRAPLRRVRAGARASATHLAHTRAARPLRTRRSCFGCGPTTGKGCDRTRR